MKIKLEVRHFARSVRAAVAGLALLAAPAWSAGASPSSRSGMGPIVYAGGVAFRVWAPNAEGVSIAGTFNSWSSTATPLAAESGGTWSVDVPGAATGDRYKYVIRWNGQELWKRDPRATQVTNSAGDSVVANLAYNWQSGYSSPGWNELVVYQMHIGGFNDQPGGGPGTFQSAIQKLDYVQSLGVSTIQLLPVAEFAGDFSWGYNPSSLFAPESAYGTPADFKAFVDACHQRNMGVYLDVVHNHWGASDLDTWIFDGPDYGYGGIYFFTDWRGQTPWAAPRPDYGRGEVRAFIKDNIFYWLDEYRVDGIRWDSTSNIWANNNGADFIVEGQTLLQWVNREVNTWESWKPMIAEDFHYGNATVWDEGAGGLNFDSQWSGSFKNQIRSAIEAQSDSDRNLADVSAAITDVPDGNPTHRVIYIESHDEVGNGRSRVPSAIYWDHPDSWWARKRSTLGAVFTMTSGGIPMILMGQEQLAAGYWDINAPDTWILDWNRANQFTGITALYRDLIHLRRNWYNNTRGLRGSSTNVFHVNNGAKVIAWHRWDQGGSGDDVVIVANLSGTRFDDYRIGFPRGGTWHTIFNSDSTLYASDYQNFGPAAVEANGAAWDGLPTSASFGLQAYSALMFSQTALPANASVGDWKELDWSAAE